MYEVDCAMITLGAVEVSTYTYTQTDTDTDDGLERRVWGKEHR